MRLMRSSIGIGQIGCPAVGSFDVEMFLPHVWMVLLAMTVR
jgi:hypothetical protein